MTEEELKISEAFKKCADAKLPDDFADRLVRHIRDNKDKPDVKPSKSIFTRLALLAASVTLVLGFMPAVFENHAVNGSAIVVHCDEIRPASHIPLQDSHLNGLGFLGICREVLRCRIKPIFRALRRRDEEEDDEQ